MNTKRYQLKNKEKTKRNILKACATMKRFTGLELSKKLALSVPTINIYLEEFQKKRYIKEIGTIGFEAGRKSRLWECTILDKHTLAIEIDIKHITIAIINLNRKIIKKHTEECVLHSNIFTSKIEEIVKNFVSRLPDKYSKNIKRLGISLPGNVSFDRKNIIFATNLKLSNINIEPLEKSLGLKIFLENEANASTIAETFLDRKKENRNMLFISISELGIGGGIIIDGKLQKGTNRKAGEIGHMSIDIEGIHCECGNNGCFERYVSEEGLLNIMKKYNFNKSIDELFLFYSKETDDIILEYSKYLGAGIKSLLYIFDSSKIVVSGRIVNYWKRLYPYLEKEVFYNNVFYRNSYETIIVESKYKENSSLIGAGLIPYLSYFYSSKKF